MLTAVRDMCNRKYNFSKLCKMSQSEEFHFGDSLNLMQDDIEFAIDQI